MAVIHAERARALVGVPFRAQGRDPATGLDCAGLVIAAFELPTDLGRTNYRLRGEHFGELMNALAGPFRRVGRGKARAGDLLLLRVADDQAHLAVLTNAGFVHADARLRRVVETPGEPEWQMAAAYRKRVTA